MFETLKYPNSREEVICLIDDNIYRLRKIAIRSLRNVDSLSCSFDSKSYCYSLAIKKRRKAHKKKRVDEYEKAEKHLAKKAKILKVETERYNKALKRFQRAEQELLDYILIVANVPEEYHDNACYEFDLIRNVINIFFGGIDGRPKGKRHGHYVIDAKTCECKYARNPDEPKTNRKKQKRHMRFDTDDRKYCAELYGCF